MTASRVNLGYLFAQPYESEYAMLRRCLIANPGVPLSIIEANLRDLLPRRSSTLSRLRTLQIPTDIFQSDNCPTGNYHRQCPQCAENLYHTDIYALSWLSRCPIHHCEFTTNCPICRLSWPDKRSLSRRDCPGCGRLSIKQIGDCIQSNKQEMDYQPVADIYEFIRKDNVEYFLCNSNLTNTMAFDENEWWRELPVTSPLFPSFQAHRRPEFSTARLEELHITLKPVHHRSTRLLPVDKEYFSPRGTPNVYHYHDINETTQRRLIEDFKAMKRIVSWIDQQTPCLHRVHISSYRHLGMKHFINGPDPCPYCLALSLWFFDVAAQKYGRLYRDNINNYPFYWEVGFDGFYKISDPYLTLDLQDHFLLNKNFIIWFYRRSLEISFVHILRFVFNVLGQIHKYRQNSNRNNFNFHYQHRIFTDQYCTVTLINDRLFFYYENEHPLDTYTPPLHPKLNSQCRNYHSYLARSYDTISSFDRKLIETELSYDTFLSLHKEFRTFTLSPLRQYGH